MVEPLSAAEIIAVRRLQISLGGVKRCGACGELKPVRAFSGYRVDTCTECVERPLAARDVRTPISRYDRCVCGAAKRSSMWMCRTCALKVRAERRAAGVP